MRPASFDDLLIQLGGGCSGLAHAREAVERDGRDDRNDPAVELHLLRRQDKVQVSQRAERELQTGCLPVDLAIFISPRLLIQSQYSIDGPSAL